MKFYFMIYSRFTSHHITATCHMITSCLTPPSRHPLHRNPIGEHTGPLLLWFFSKQDGGWPATRRRGILVSHKIAAPYLSTDMRPSYSILMRREVYPSCRVSSLPFRCDEGDRMPSSHLLPFPHPKHKNVLYGWHVFVFGIYLM